MTEPQEVFVRGYPIPPRDQASKPRRELGPSSWSIVFDTETTTGTSQRLRVGSYQIRHQDTVTEQGFFYDIDALTHIELRALTEHAEDTGQRLLELEEWIPQVLLRYGADLGGWIVGFNLPFDISRIAADHKRTGSGSKLMRGGFTFGIGNERRIQVKKAGAKAAFIRLTQPSGGSPEARNRDSGGDATNFTGYVVDVSSLATALLSGSRSLRSLAEVLDTPTRKLEVDDYSAPIDAAFLEYAMVDCQVTWECFNRLRGRYDALGLERPVWRIISEASVGKAYLDQMSLTPWRLSDPEFPDWLTACVMETYYGGRTETRIRRHAIPGVYTDFLSQYPTAFSLQGLWKYQIAQNIEWPEEDPAIATGFLDGLTAADVLEKAFWVELQRIVLIELDGDRLPTRTTYGRDNTLNVAVADRRRGPAQWYTMADAAASVLETGRTPRIIRTIRFEPGDPQTGLRPIEIGDQRIDPTVEDVIARLIEIRRDLKTQIKNTDGDTALLDARQTALKVTANSVSYGIGIEMNTTEYTKDQTVTIARTDGTTYPFPSKRVERPGRWFNPTIATFTAAGGRLLVAAAMRLVHDIGGEFVFSDTDSVFIAATEHGGTIACEGTDTGQLKLLSWAEVDAINARFATLNPYRFDASILELEDENYVDGVHAEVWCWSVASKRCALYRIIDGRIELARNANGEPKRSEHGLGHLINPIDPATDWVSAWWIHLLRVELGNSPEPPEWFGRPAIGKLGVSSHHELAAFKNRNTGLDYPDQVRPFGFMLMAHVEPLIANAPKAPACLVAGYDNQPNNWTGLDWFDRANKKSPVYRVRTGDIAIRRQGEIPVQTLGGYFTTYRFHAEAKATDSTGHRSRPRTTGVLRPRTIEASSLVRVGKEAARLNEAPVTDDDDRAIRYLKGRCRNCQQPLTGNQRNWCSDRCRMHHTRRDG